MYVTIEEFIVFFNIDNSMVGNTTECSTSKIFLQLIERMIAFFVCGTQLNADSPSVNASNDNRKLVFTSNENLQSFNLINLQNVHDKMKCKWVCGTFYLDNFAVMVYVQFRDLPNAHACLCVCACICVW